MIMGMLNTFAGFERDLLIETPRQVWRAQRRPASNWTASLF
jgi:hypothetical protein